MEYKFEPHSFNKKMLNYFYCSRCGLVALKNDFTQWSIKMGCGHRDHPSYEAKRFEFTRLR
jgi:hypothetical protein